MICIFLEILFRTSIKVIILCTHISEIHTVEEQFSLKIYIMLPGHKSQMVFKAGILLNDHEVSHIMRVCVYDMFSHPFQYSPSSARRRSRAFLVTESWWGVSLRVAQWPSTPPSRWASPAWLASWHSAHGCPSTKCSQLYVCLVFI